MQGEGVQVTNQDFSRLVSLIAIGFMTSCAYALGKVFSPSGSNKNPDDEDLVKRFSQYPLRLQRGMLDYAEKMRQSYQSKKR